MLADRVIPAPTDPRVSIRLEAENFRVLDRVEVEYVNDRKASKRMSVRGTGEGAYRIETSFFEPYTAVEWRYDIEVRLFDRADAGETYGLLVQGRPQGRPWRAPGIGSRWVSHTLHDVTVRAGDSIAVEVSNTDSGSFKLDYIQLVRR